MSYGNTGAAVRRSFKNVFFNPATQCFVVNFSYDAELVASIKAAIEWKKRSYDGAKKEWIIKAEAGEALYEWVRIKGFTIGDSALSRFKLYERPVYQDIALPDLHISIPIKGALMPYQAQGVAYNLAHEGRTLIGDEMGLGKTLQAIATVVALNAFPCLVICPASLKMNWLDEWAKWTTKRAAIMSEKISVRPGAWFASEYLQVCVTNYESLPKYFVADWVRDPKGEVTDIILNNLNSYFKSIIIDESHYLGNQKTQRYKITSRITDKKEHLLLLSGTPLSNQITELVSQLKILRAIDYFGGPREFFDKYGHITHRNSHTKENAGLLEELKYKLKQVCYYRREKKDVIADLPDRFRQIIRVPITTRAEYTKAEDDFREYLQQWKQLPPAEIAKKMGAELMVKIGVLKQISARGKLKDAKGFIEDIISQGEKIIVFAHHREIITALKAEFDDFMMVVGGMGDIAKDNNVRAFQENPDVKGIFCSIEAASVGLNLHASSRVLFVELPWTSSKTDQAEARAHRIGQKSTVNCYYLLGENTIDEKIYDLIQRKRQLFNSVTGAQDGAINSVYSELFADLLK